jgi:hypothetical protein
MDEQAFAAIVRSIRPLDDLRLLDAPVAETSLDSYDLLELRSALETRIGRAISDQAWLGARTLRELLLQLP